MQKQRYFSKKIALVSLLLGLSHINPALANGDYQRYEQAKIAVSYEGEVGNLLQQLASRLNVGYISYNIDSSREIAVKQGGVNTLADLLNNLNSQLGDSNIRFTEIGNRTFLVLSSGTEEIGGVKKKAAAQYIGQAVFSEAEPVKNFIELQLDEMNEQESAVQPQAVQAVEEVKTVESALQNLETSALEKAIVVETPLAGIPLAEMPTASSVETAVETAVESKPLDPKTEKQMNLLNDIVEESTNQKVLAQYKNKKAPSYQITSKADLGLSDIKVTPLSTFLVFATDVDTSTLSVKGKYEKLAQFGNYIGILHKKNRAPAQIEITDNNGRKLVLKSR